MDADGKPEGGAWNFDKENRKSDAEAAQAAGRIGSCRQTPSPRQRDGSDVERLFPTHFGSLDGFGYATTPDEAET